VILTIGWQKGRSPRKEKAMNPQLERLFHSVRRGIEENVKLALKNMEIPQKRDFDRFRKKIEGVKKKEFSLLHKKLDEVKKSLKKMESFRPYIEAFDAIIRTSPSKGRRKRGGSQKKSKKR